MTYEQAKQQLRQLAGNYSGHGASRQMDPLGLSLSAPMGTPGYQQGSTLPGAINLRSNMDPTDEQIKAYMKLMGGSDQQAQQPAATANQGAAPAADNSIASLMAQISQQYQKQMDAANAANEARYSEIKGNKQAQANRVMNEVGNWGNFQKAMNDEKAKETLGNIQANLASRGLGNTTIGDSFRQRNARDLQLTNQDLSERKSDRYVNYDNALSNDYNAFIERKTDKAPEYGQMQALLAKLGEAQAYQQAAAARQQQQQASVAAVPQDGGQGMGMGAPSQAAWNHAGRQAQAMQQQFMGGFFNRGTPTMQLGISSNAYPHKSAPSDVTAAENEDWLRHLRGRQFIQAPTQRPPSQLVPYGPSQSRMYA